MANLFPEKGLHKYSFVYTCREDKSLELDDGSCKVFLSAKGTADDVSGEMQGFLAYLETQTCETGLTRKIHAELEKARNHERWRVEYMTLLERDERMRAEGREEGRAEGREEGREEGRTEGIEEGLERGIFGLIKVLLGMDMPVEEIKDKIVTTYSISQDKAEEYLKAATSVSPAE